MMSENIAQNMYSKQGTKNYPTQLHLIGHFRKLNCVMLRSFGVIDFLDQICKIHKK
jgi:hypothetical protein